MKNAYKEVRDLSTLKERMINCEQMKGMNVYEHGISVAKYFHDLCYHVKSGEPATCDWRIPDWISNELLWDSIYDIEDIEDYQVYHDCGKPFCIEYDNYGKKHFPNHAQVSKDLWLQIGGNNKVANLIGMDMDVHLIKAVDVPEFALREEAATLLITALCEVHSNSRMFGGITSSSFKAKWKQIDRRGKAIIRLLEEKQAAA
jgi:hypothetical protein